jgi:hypothetical protein
MALVAALAALVVGTCLGAAPQAQGGGGCQKGAALLPKPARRSAATTSSGGGLQSKGVYKRTADSNTQEGRRRDLIELPAKYAATS